MNVKWNDLKGILGISLLGVVILICTQGLTFTGLQVFDDELINAFDWSKSELKFRDFLNLGIAALIMPFMGAVIDKYGVKKAITFGLLLMSVCIYLYSLINSSTHMYGIHVGFALALATAGTLPVIIMVSQRVSKMRGTAIGIALAGTSMAGLVMPRVAKWLLESNDWRGAFQYEALIPLFVLLLVWIFLKDAKVEEDGKSATDDLVEVTFQDALRMKEFWFLSIIGFFTYYGVMGVFGNLFLFIREMGYDAATAVNALGFMSILMLFSKLLSGVLTDFINKYTLFRIQVAIMLVGTLMLSMNSKDIVWYAIPIFAIGWGGLYTLINYIIITVFGVNAAGKIGGTISTFESLGAGLGIWLSGLISDRTGSYAASFTAVVVFLAISLALSIFIKPIAKEKLEYAD